MWFRNMERVLFNDGMYGVAVDQVCIVYGSIGERYKGCEPGEVGKICPER